MRLIQEIANLMLLAWQHRQTGAARAWCAATATCRATGTMGINERAICGRSSIHWSGVSS
ncbi:hypothetical protein ACXX9E_28585 [Pseudomonas sp. GNP014]